MVTDRELQDAKNRAHQEGYEEAVAELRRFRGTYSQSRSGDRLVPDLSEPEHVAYTEYRDRLAGWVDTFAEEEAGARERLDAFIQQRNELRADFDEALRERRQARAGKFVVRRAAGWVGDLMLPAARRLSEYAEDEKELRAHQQALIGDRIRFTAEHERVSQWLSEAAEYMARSVADEAAGR